VRDEEGTPLYWQGVLLDITERKAAEEAVKENEKRFRQLFNQSVDALFVHDASGNIEDCNAEACRALGYNREELLSLRIKDLATKQISEEEKSSRTGPTLWERALSGEPGKVAGIHIGEHRRKDGTAFPCGGLRGLRRLWRGTHDLRLGPRHNRAQEAEEEIRELNESLERRVEERTAELRRARSATAWSSRAPTTESSTGTSSQALSSGTTASSRSSASLAGTSRRR
jgi:PAS domain S-box-containing protein